MNNLIFNFINMKIIIRNTTKNNKIIFLNNFMNFYSTVFVGLFLTIFLVALCVWTFIEDKLLLNILRVFFDIWFIWVFLTMLADSIINIYLIKTNQKMFEVSFDVNSEYFLNSVRELKKNENLEINSNI